MLPYFLVGLSSFAAGWVATSLVLKRPFIPVRPITEGEFALVVFVLLSVISLIARW